MTMRIPTMALAAAAACLALPSLAAGDTGRVGAWENYWKPRKIQIDVGDRVRWRNREGTHSVVMKTGGQEIDSVISGDAAVRSSKFRDPGSYRFVCRFHHEQGMKGKVVVDERRKRSRR